MKLQMRLGLALTLLLLIAGSSAWAEINVRLSQGIVLQGDSFTLQIEAAGQNRGNPDLSVLEQDFEILGSGSGTQVQIINGVRSDKKTWSVTLRPRRLGVLTLPPIRIDGEQSSALQVTVREAPANAFSSGDAVLLETQVEEKTATVQQQLRMVTRLYMARPLLGGELTDPQIENAVVERLGEKRLPKVERGGRLYSVIERRYAVFPEQSGTLRIPPLRFSGELEAARSSTSPAPSRGFPGDPVFEQFFGNDDFFSGSPFSRPSGELFRAQSAAMEIEIRPRPEAYGDDPWVPAAALTLHDSWEDSPPDFSTGDPVSRTLVLEAQGLAASQLPELSIAGVPGMGVYPEKAVTSTRTDGSWVYARSSINISYVPQKNAIVTVPGLRLAWWDTQQQEKKFAELQDWSVAITAFEPAAASAAEAQAIDSSASAPDPLQPELGVDAASEVHTWRFGLVLAGALLSLLLLALAYRWRRPLQIPSAIAAAASQPQRGREVPGDSEPQALQVIAAACHAADAAATRDALLHWAALKWPGLPASSLGGIGTKLPPLAPALQALDRWLYAPGQASWNGVGFWQELQNALCSRIETQKVPEDDGLKPLYPQ